MKSPAELQQMFVLACQLHESGNLEEALKLYRELSHHIGGFPDLHYNYGLAAYDTNQFELAEEQYEIACKGKPDDPDVHFNQGLNFRRLDKIDKAIDSFKRAVAVGDNSVDTLYNLALSHQNLQHTEEAAGLYSDILSQNPEHLSSLNNYAYLCHRSGDTKKAEHLYTALLKLKPDHEGAHHMLASISGRTPDCAPLSYVEEVFDGYAHTFETSLLQKLKYQTPIEMWKRYRKLFPSGKRLHCLDLGCGTGLAGIEFERVSTQITGVDISEKILKVAEEKKIYDRLVKDDILHFLENADTPYDLILAADVFTYMGDLKPVFKACMENSSQECHFCFSVEESDAGEFEIKQTGRFGHAVEYIENLAKKTSWQTIDTHFSRLRQEHGEWINGYLFILSKK